jgi:hypothetical protein
MSLRFDQAACGTSSTGAGALTLAAAPTALACADPYAIWSGAGYGTSQGVPIPYSIVEYTNSSLTTPKQSESGMGVLTFGASLAACSLARTLVLQKATSMDSPPATVTGATSGPTAISIGTAANVVIYFGPESWQFAEVLTAVALSGITSADNLGVINRSTNTGAVMTMSNSGVVHYCAIELDFSILTKSVTLRCGASGNYTGGSNSLAAALYEIDPATGLPGKLVLDFGTVSGFFNTANTNSTFTAAAAVFVQAGHYILALLPIYSGGSGFPNARGSVVTTSSPFGTASGVALGGALHTITVAGQSAFTDPATLTSAAAYGNATTPYAIFRST